MAFFSLFLMLERLSERRVEVLRCDAKTETWLTLFRGKPVNGERIFSVLMNLPKKNLARPNRIRKSAGNDLLPSRIRRKTGLFVVFLSPDGGGKTSVARAVLQRLATNFEKTKYLYWRPGVLPEIRDLVRLRFRPKEARTNFEPHGRKDQGRMVSYFRFFYYTFDLILGYFKLGYLKYVGTLIVMDRYYYDFLIDRKRYGFNISDRLPKLILKIIPKPDIVFYLDNSSRNLHSRKQELTLNELERQIQMFRRLITKLPHSYTINTDKSLPAVVDEVCALIIRRRTEGQDFLF